MLEMNTCQGVTVLVDKDFDTLVVTDMGDIIALAQMAEDGTLHNVIISRETLLKAAKAVKVTKRKEAAA